MVISSWRWRKAARRARKERQNAEESGEANLMIPNHFKCPISLDLMKDPVTLSTGITYDRENIERWIEAGNRTCPITKEELRSLEPIPNHAIRKMIQDWCVENRSHGVERIPTPRVPISSMEVMELLDKIDGASRRQEDDQVGLCEEIVAKIKKLMKESERNKRCIVSNGAGRVLAAVFERFLERSSFDENFRVLEEILSALTLMFPLDGEAQSRLGSATSLRCIVWLMRHGSLSGRRNSVLALKEIVSSNKQKAQAFIEIEGAAEALYRLIIKEPICPSATKASLLVIYHLISSSPLLPSYDSNHKFISRFVEMGLVALLLEMLVDADRSMCEKAFGVFDRICNWKEGREMAYGNSLTVPVLVKKLLRVSDLATEFSVSILWKLCKDNGGEEIEDGRAESVLCEALQVGAFQKLLLLLQVGCGDRTKEKATKLLKMLNIHRERLECIDSSDFKDLKRPF